MGKADFAQTNSDLLRGSRPLKTAGTSKLSRNKRALSRPANRALKSASKRVCCLLAPRREHLQAAWHKAKHPLDALQRSGFADWHEHPARDTVGGFELLQQPLDFRGILALRVMLQHVDAKMDVAAEDFI